MPASGISFAVRGLSQMNKAMAKRVRKMGDQTPAYKRCAVFLDQWTMQNWKSDGGKVGGWEPLNEGYAKWKKKHFGGKAKMMFLTGRLRASLAAGSGSNKRSAWVRTKVPYAMKHQEGDGVPKRQIIPTKKDAEVKKITREIFNDWAKDALK